MLRATLPRWNCTLITSITKLTAVDSLTFSPLAWMCRARSFHLSSSSPKAGDPSYSGTHPNSWPRCTCARTVQKHMAWFSSIPVHVYRLCLFLTVPDGYLETRERAPNNPPPPTSPHPLSMDHEGYLVGVGGQHLEDVGQSLWGLVAALAMVTWCYWTSCIIIPLTVFQADDAAEQTGHWRAGARWIPTRMSSPAPHNSSSAVREPHSLMSQLTQRLELDYLTFKVGLFTRELSWSSHEFF